MLHRSVGIIAASALGAGAFLIPANVAQDNVVEAALNAKQSVVQLPCPDCAFPYQQQQKAGDVNGLEQKEDELWIQGGANSVVVKLTVSENGRELLANGEVIFPIERRMGIMMAEKIYVDQVASSASIQEIESGSAKTASLEVTGSGVSVDHEATLTPEGHKIIPITHSIFELERQPVTLDDIHIQVLQTVDGELFIAQVSTEGLHVPQPADFFAPPEWVKETEHDLFDIMRPHHEEHHDPLGVVTVVECKNLPPALCKLKSMIEHQISGMHRGIKGGLKKMGCHGGKGKGKKGGRPSHGMLSSHTKPHFLLIGQVEVEAVHQNNDGHGPPKHHFVHSFVRGLAAILIPTMAGVAVGMVVSLIGLCIGRLIGFLWIHFYRGGRRGYESVRLEEDGEATEDANVEKQAAIVSEPSESLPVYEQAPSYDDVEREQK